MRHNRILWWAAVCIASLCVCSVSLAGDSGLLGVEEGPTARPTKAPAAAPVMQSPLERGRQLLKEDKIDEAVKFMERAAGKEPGDFDLQILLGKVLLVKCEKMKEDGNGGYRVLVHRPYQLGYRLFRMSPARPEPYFIVAKSLVINERPRKAGRSIKKAIHYAGSTHPDIAEYWVVWGDAWMGVMEMENDHWGYDEAKKCYDRAESMRSDDPKFLSMVKRHREVLEETYARVH